MKTNQSKMLIRKISIIGAGYVGFSLAVLLSQKKEVSIFDTDRSKLKIIQNKKSPIQDDQIDNFLENKNLNLYVANTLIESIINSDLIILALPTNYSIENDSLDTSIIEETISSIVQVQASVPILIKSTVPIGFTKKIQSLNPHSKIVFSPEFLREGNALFDNLEPQRIIIGDKTNFGNQIANLFLEFTSNKPNILLMESSEAEAVKLFSNTYLASRVSFFNELDTFALEHNFDSKAIIDGVTSDSRIGKGYCNPSFGYGGYCLPKDSKQLESNFESIPQEIISSIILSNSARKRYIANYVITRKPKVLGIYRLIMKKGSDNYRDSAVLDIILMIKKLDTSIRIIVYEPLSTNQQIIGCDLYSSSTNFLESSTLILANRMDDLLLPYKEKVFTRDVYGEN